MNTEQLSTVPPDETQQPLIFGIVTPTMLKEIDVSKMQQLLDMKLKMDAIEAEKAFNQALAGFQADMPPVFKWRAESKGKYNYASYDDIMRIARPLLRKHGLSVTASQHEDENNLTITMRIGHIGGYSNTSNFTLPKDGPIKTQDGRNVTSQAQAQASANTYARRNCLCNALDIVVTDDDDDAQAASTQFLNEHEVSEVSALLDKFGKDRNKTLTGMLDWLKLESIDQIPAARFKDVMGKLRTKLQTYQGQ